MSRSSALLAGLLTLSVVLNFWFFWKNTQLQISLVGAEATLAAQVPAEAEVADRSPASAARGSAEARTPTARPRRGPSKARVPREGTERRAAMAEPGTNPEASRTAALRAGIREQIREGVIATLYDTAEIRGWDQDVTYDAETIVSTSFDTQEELRERVRAGELPWAAGKTDIAAIREAANDELRRLLGEDEYAVFIATLRGEDGGVNYIEDGFDD